MPVPRFLCEIAYGFEFAFIFHFHSAVAIAEQLKVSFDSSLEGVQYLASTISRQMKQVHIQLYPSLNV